ncbi:MAG: transporter substrate-binding domain-containing protein [Bacteroidales bacterium]
MKVLKFKFIPIPILPNLFFLILTTLLLTSCLDNHRDNLNRALAENDTVKRYRIQEIQERGRLVAITDNNTTDYFIFRGTPMGYQFEKLKMFADYLGVDLEIKLSNNLDEAFRKLDRGDADLIAMGITVTLNGPGHVAFTEPILQTRQMLVQRKPENWRKMRNWDEIEQAMVRNPLDLAGKTVYVPKNSPFSNRLKNLSEEIGQPVYLKEERDRKTEQLVEAVANGEIAYTVCNEYMALLFERMYPELDIRTAISFPQNLAWAVREDSDSLRVTINQWMTEFNKTTASRFLLEKYFSSTRMAHMAKSEYVSYNQGKISAYDEILRSMARKYHLDWRLVASLIYQESQFNPNARSWKGAFGLMQMMPATAAIFGIDTNSTATEQLEAGIRYIKALDRELPAEIKDPNERMKFILASYNVGIAHVYDARRLAEKNGQDPNVWSGNVDYYILNKSNPAYYRDSVVRYGYARGEETYNFVIEILDRFEHYKNVIND